MSMHKFGYRKLHGNTHTKILEMTTRINNLKMEIDREKANVKDMMAQLQEERKNIKDIKLQFNRERDNTLSTLGRLTANMKENIFKTLSELNGNTTAYFNKEIDNIIRGMRDDKSYIKKEITMLKDGITNLQKKFDDLDISHIPKIETLNESIVLLQKKCINLDETVKNLKELQRVTAKEFTEKNKKLHEEMSTMAFLNKLKIIP